MKRVLLILAPLLILVVMVGVTFHLVAPSVETWAREQIHSFSKRYLPVEVDAESLSIRFFPPALHARGIEVVPKNPEKMGFDFMSIKSVEARLDLLQVLVGKLAVSDLIIEDLKTKLTLDELVKASPPSTGGGSAGPAVLDLTPVFEKLKIIPIHRLLLNHVNAEVQSHSQQADMQIVDANFLVVNERESLALEAEIPVDPFSFHDFHDSFYLRTSGLLTQDRLTLTQVHWTFGPTDIVFSAELDHLSKLLTDPHGQIHFHAISDLAAVQKKLKDKVKLPDLQGHLDIEADAQIQGHSIANAKLKFQSHDLAIDHFGVGDLRVQGNWTQDTSAHGAFKASEFQLTNDAAQIDLKNLVLNWDRLNNGSQWSLETKLTTEMLDLNELLQQIKVGEIPIDLYTAGDFGCQGPIYPDFSMHCSGEAKGDMLEVGSEHNEAHNILKIDDFNVKGDVDINKQAVRYKGHLEIGPSHGDSDGEISFAEGFKINFASPHFDFASVKRLAGLKFAGTGVLAGEVHGDKSTAQFTINTDGQNMEFEDFLLGSPKMTVHFEHGNLHFQNIQGTMGTTRYQGSVDVSLRNESLAFDIDAPSVELQDIQKAIERKLKMPMDFIGPATAHAKGEGPLKLGQMSYDLQVNGERDTIAGESLDAVDAHLHADKGHVTLGPVKISKNHSQIVGGGTANPEGVVNFSFEGAPLLLEDSDYITAVGNAIFGQVNTKIRVTGPIVDPDLVVQLKTQNVSVDEAEMPNSEAELRLNRRFFRGNVNLLEGRLTSQFQLPLQDDQAFYVEASARNWNYAQLFSLIGGTNLAKEYRSSLTGDITVRADKGGFANADGQGSIFEATLQRADVQLRNPGSMEMRMNHGQIALDNFRLASDESFVEVSSKGFSEKNMSMKIYSRLPLHITQIFFPFLDELSGLATLKMNLSGALEHPQILGSGTLQDGFVRVKGFPHAFEKVNASAQFSQNKVIVSDISALLGGGTIEGDGNISIEGPRRIPMLFHFDLDNATLNVPDQVRTSGSAQLDVSGNWFPFTLSGTYHVQSGAMTKEFSSFGVSKSTQQSLYLPKSLVHTTADPLNLDLKVAIEGPFSLKNSIIDSNVSGSLQIKGAPASPILLGKITIDKNSKLNFRDKIFDINNATVQFNNPKEVDPELYLSANSRVGDYDISLITQGTASSPIVRLSSTPPLSDQDIVSLMALGSTTTSDRGSAFVQKDQSSAQAGQAAAAVFGQATKSFQKALDVDFQATSAYDDTKNMSTQSYTLKKRLTDTFTLSATVVTGDQSEQQYKLNYKINSKFNISTSLEDLQPPTNGSTLAPQTNGNILGIDFEYKQEFR